MASCSNIVKGVATAVNLLCDVCMLGDAIYAWGQASDRNESTLLETATIINSLALVGFSVAEIRGLMAGKRSEVLKKLKSREMVFRMLNVPLQLVLQGMKMGTQARETGSIEFRSIIRLLNRGIIAPLADVSRTAASMAAYYEQRYLDMTPQELKKEKRPIYEEVDDGVYTHIEIEGYAPVDLEECRRNLASLNIRFAAATIVRVATQSSFAEMVVCNLGIPTIQRLAAFFGVFPPPTGRHGDGAGSSGGAAPYDEERDLDLNLLNYPNIPEPLHRDQVFQQYICPITQLPIRDPVRDPTNGMTLYERRAIVTWLQHNPISPLTRMPLGPTELQEAPTVRNIINHRLQEYQDELRHFLAEHASAPATD